MIRKGVGYKRQKLSFLKETYRTVHAVRQDLKERDTIVSY